jgi:hypothetical protein
MHQTASELVGDLRAVRDALERGDFPVAAQLLLYAHEKMVDLEEALEVEC